MTTNGRSEDDRWNAVSSAEVEEKNRDLFLHALGDSSWRVRKASVEKILSSSHPEIFLKGIVEGLHAQDNAGRRNACVEVLTRLGSSSVPRLNQEARSRDRDVRKFVADVLGDIGTGGTEPALGRLLRDRDENVSFAAAEALGKIGSKEAQGILMKEWSRKDLTPLVRLAVLEALANLQVHLPLDRLTRDLGDPMLAQPVIRLAGCHDSVAAARLILSVFDGSKENLRSVALLALDRMLQRRGPAWSHVVRGEIGELKRDMRIALYTGLQGWLESPDPHLQFAAARVVAFLSLMEFSSAVLELVSTERGAMVAHAVFDRLGPDAVRSLVLVFHRWSPEKQAFALELFGKHSVKESLGIVDAAIEDPDPLVRGASASALGHLADANRVGRLLMLLDVEEEESVRDRILDGLVRLRVRHRDPILRHVERGIKSAAAPLVTCHVRLLGACGTKRNLPALALLLQDQSPPVRREALKAMVALGDPRARQHAVAFLNDDEAENRSAGCKALAELGGLGAAGALERMLNDKNGWVRLEAVRGLASLQLRDSDRKMRALERSLVDPMGAVVVVAFEELLRSARKRGLKYLGPVLAHSESRVQADALAILDRHGFDPMEPEIQGKVAGLRDEAKILWLDWLTRSRRPLPRTLLREMARQERNPAVQRLAIARLGRKP